MKREIKWGDKAEKIRKRLSKHVNQKKEVKNLRKKKIKSASKKKDKGVIKKKIKNINEKESKSKINKKNRSVANKEIKDVKKEEVKKRNKKAGNLKKEVKNLIKNKVRSVRGKRVKSVIKKKSKKVSKGLSDKRVKSVVKEGVRGLDKKKRKGASKRRIERIKVGIPNFDSLVQGGFEKNSTNLLIGGSGAGKTIFATQFLVEGLKSGESCLYVTFEEKREQFFGNMKKFGWNLDDYVKKGKFVFLEYSPIKVKTMLDEGGGIIESLILEKKITRIVIDSISSFALLFEDELAKREAALALFNMIKVWNCTALLTLEEEPPITGGIEPKALEFESDSLIVLYFIREKVERLRFLEIIKMRGTKHSKKIFPFEIEKSGIIVKRHPVSKIFVG